MNHSRYLGFVRLFLTVAIAALLAGIVTWPMRNAHAAQPAKPRLRHRDLGPRDREPEFLKLGYVELAGNEAVRFLVGNTVVRRTADAPKWLRSTEDDDQKYYLRDAHNVILCHPVGTNCLTFTWTVKGNKICIDPGIKCDEPEYPYSARPRVLQAPHPNERTGQIGVYIEYGAYVQPILKGNATIADFTDTNPAAELIEVSSDDFAEEIRAAQDKPHASTTVSVVGPHAASILIGNTFMTGDTTADDHGNARLCPYEGYYYSPDGRLIQFDCRDNDQWGVSISRWILKAGAIGVQDDQDDKEPEKFVYGGPIQGAVLIPSGKSNSWRVQGWALGDKRTLGYVGNVLKFK